MSKPLPKQIYQNLSISQRLRAAWQAQARDDNSELDRLSSPADAGEYVIDRVSAAMGDLQAFGMAVQIDLMSLLVSHLIDLLRIKGVSSDKDREDLLENLESTRTEAASIAAAIDEVAIHIGLTPEDFKANRPPDHPILQSFLDSVAEMASEDLVQKYRDEFLSFLRRRHPKIACFQPA